MVRGTAAPRCGGKLPKLNAVGSFAAYRMILAAFPLNARVSHKCKRHNLMFIFPDSQGFSEFTFLGLGI
jgi:hypothetical protein